jgi:hypothetical protein
MVAGLQTMLETLQPRMILFESPLGTSKFW